VENSWRFIALPNVNQPEFPNLNLPDFPGQKPGIPEPQPFEQAPEFPSWLPSMINSQVPNVAAAQALSWNIEDGDLNPNCPEGDDPWNPTHLAHPTDCGKFYKCLNGRAFELSCPVGQQWNAKEKYCDYPINGEFFLMKS
jgi:hypothetical protein